MQDWSQRGLLLGISAAYGARCVCDLQCAGTSQLAALGPNLVVINAFTYSLTSLCVACMRYALPLFAFRAKHACTLIDIVWTVEGLDLRHRSLA